MQHSVRSLNRNGSSSSLGSQHSLFLLWVIRRPHYKPKQWLVLCCTTAGTSASSEPKWLTDIVHSYWTTPLSGPRHQQRLLRRRLPFAPSAIIEPFEPQATTRCTGSTDVYRFHAGSNANVTGNIVFDSNTYTRLPIQAGGF